MTRLLLLVVLCLATWYYFPDARSMLLDAAQPVVAPVLGWSAKEEMTQIGRNVLDHERLTGQLPVGTAWLPWLEFRYATPEFREDSWGSLYQLDANADSVTIISYGPDRVRGTPDDLRVATERE